MGREEGGGDLGGAVGGSPAIGEGLWERLVWLWLWAHRQHLWSNFTQAVLWDWCVEVKSVCTCARMGKL